ncbi:hypothetical protein [Flammeovirga aprica]|uniref:Outer membrane protein beta-barrel domain-containing protein n=1 Tax=Flammeovirga aprica JL-4 TaxID=694437 RepID=A0A7X9RW94_9BACT|nr:hypothetical protein [Flammeovirga aprica]NME69891.1 hypothetical protein [Flammeovirga aprica JL-4]
MTKRFIFSIVLLITVLFSLESTAQNTKRRTSSNYSNGSKFYLNTGVGVNTRGVPFYIGLDYNGVHPDISIGGSFGIHNYKHYHKNHYRGHRAWNLSFNGNYHFNRIMNIPNNFDFYAGANIGLYSYSDRHDYPIDNWSYIRMGLQIGGRWFINDTIGLNLQFGGGTQYSGANFGLTFRL